MNSIISILLIGFMASFLISLSGSKTKIRNFIFTISPFIVFWKVLNWPNFENVFQYEIKNIDLVNFGESLSLSITNSPNTISQVFLYVVTFLWIFASFYTISYVNKNSIKKSTRFLSLFTLAVSSAIGLSISANLLTFFIFYELLTIATWPLVSHKETREAIGAGRRYLIYTLSGASLMILGIAIIWKYSGNLDFQQSRGMLDEVPLQFRSLTIGLLLLGASVKAAIVPLHSWLPRAMVAPTPVSALLHAVAVVKAGVFAMLIMMENVIGKNLMLESGASKYVLIASGITILYSSLRACGEDSLKKRLAYSTIAHLSYIIYAGVLNVGIALIHFVAHALMKIVLFMVAGMIQTMTRKRKISEMDGIGSTLPKTFTVFTVSALGLIGLPPALGFLSKFFLLGWLPGDLEFLYGWIFVIAGLLSGVYLFPIVVKGWFSTNKLKKINEENGMLVPMILITISACIMTFLGGGS